MNDATNQNIPKYTLINASAIYNVLDNDIESPLTLAMRLGQQDMVLYMLNRPTDFGKRPYHPEIKYAKASSETPLLLTVNLELDRDLARLLELGADVNARDAVDNTPLMVAITLSRFNIAENILRYDPYVCAKNLRQEIALDLVMMKTGLGQDWSRSFDETL